MYTHRTGTVFLQGNCLVFFLLFFKKLVSYNMNVVTSLSSQLEWDPMVIGTTGWQWKTVAAPKGL